MFGVPSETTQSQSLVYAREICRQDFPTFSDCVVPGQTFVVPQAPVGAAIDFCTTASDCVYETSVCGSRTGPF